MEVSKLKNQIYNKNKVLGNLPKSGQDVYREKLKQELFLLHQQLAEHGFKYEYDELIEIKSLKSTKIR